MDLTTNLRSLHSLRRASLLFVLLALVAMAPFLSAAAHATAEKWDAAVAEMEAKINQIPVQYADGDQEGVETSIRQAYYEVYQVSGLEAEIDHRLGKERNDEFVSQLLSLRDLTREGSSQDLVEEKVAGTIGLLRTDVAELKDAPEVTDKWTRVATRATDQLDLAKSTYANGDYAAAANAARDAYLAHYEADGLEKATISYLGQGRVSELETMFTQLRQTGRDGSLSVEEFTERADTLAEALRTDAAELDSLTSQTELGWSGFWASFAILLREGAEALLVVAALVTYAVKAGRRDQVLGLVIGVIAAVVSAIGLAFLFSAHCLRGFGPRAGAPRRYHRTVCRRHAHLGIELDSLQGLGQEVGILHPGPSRARSDEGWSLCTCLGGLPRRVARRSRDHSLLRPDSRGK